MQRFRTVLYTNAGGGDGDDDDNNKKTIHETDRKKSP